MARRLGATEVGLSDVPLWPSPTDDPGYEAGHDAHDGAGAVIERYSHAAERSRATTE